MQPTEEPNNEVEIPDHVLNVNFDELPVVNNPDCEHEFVREAESEIPGTYTEMCIKPKCGRGRIVRL